MLKNTDKSYFTYNYVLEFKYNFGQFLCKNSHEIFSAIFTHFVSIFDAFLTASVFTTFEKKPEEIEKCIFFDQNHFLDEIILPFYWCTTLKSLIFQV